MNLINLLIAILFSSSIAFAGETVEVSKSQPVPFDGILFDQDAAKQTVEMFRNAESFASEAETLKGLVSTKDQQILELNNQIAAMQKTNALREEALIRADERQKLQDIMDNRFIEVLAQNQKVIDEAWKAADNAQKVLEKAQNRIESLEKRQFWSMILGPLGAAIGFAFGVMR